MRSQRRRFLFRLALALGKTVTELECIMREAELREWMAFAGIEPFGDQQHLEDSHTAMIVATMANAWRGKNQPSRNAEDFLLLRPPPKVEQTGLTGKQGAHYAKRIFDGDNR